MLPPSLSKKLDRMPAEIKREVFLINGISMKSWAEARGFNPTLVYQILTGRRKCLRGQSHDIARELGMK